MIFHRNLLAFLLVSTVSFQAAAVAPTCGSVFTSSSAALEKLVLETSVSENQILKAALSDYEGSLTMPRRAQKHILSFFEIFQKDAHYREQIEVEIKRRNYKKLLEEMGITTHSDPSTWIRKNRNSLSLLLSTALNGSANALSYHYLGQAGFVVHIPKFRFFKPEEIPDAVLYDLLISPKPTGAAQSFFTAHFKHDADLVAATASRLLNLGILVTFASANYQLLTDPQGYINERMQETSAGINRAAYEANERTIEKLKAKKAEFEKSGNHEKAAKAQELIENLEKQNKKLSSNKN